MIIWITGNSGAGKTTLFEKWFNTPDTIHLDGDQMRRSISSDLSLSREDREQNCLRIAKLAFQLSRQGFDVVVCVIAPYESLRKVIQEVCGCTFIYITGGRKPSEEYPYEIPVSPDLVVKGNEEYE